MAQIGYNVYRVTDKGRELLGKAAKASAGAAIIEMDIRLHGGAVGYLMVREDKDVTPK